MNKAIKLSVGLLVCAASTSYAGSLSKDNWTPSGCGSLPATPVINDSSVDAFNKSVTEINNWQTTAKSYFECLVKEANADNSIIAEAANKAQAKYREEVTKISAEADAAGKKLESK